MAILNTFTHTKDTYILAVEQDTEYQLVYINGTKETVVITSALLADGVVLLPISIDGNYKLTLVAEGETDVVITFHVKHNLRNSIVKDALYLLCGNSDCLDSSSTADCTSGAAKQCLKHKAIFTKLLSYQHYYIPRFEINYITRFANFVSSMLSITPCDIQAVINGVLREECITGGVKNVDKFFKLYFALYWLGMYFIEKTEAGTDQDALDHVDTVYKYASIIECICGLCIELDEAEDIFNASTGGDIGSIVYHWQFEDTITDIDFAPTINLDYLLTKEDISIETFEAGHNFDYTGIGRIAFALTNVSKDAYRIQDFFGVDVTETIFDTYYNVSSSTQIYISKEYYAAPSIYFKLVNS